MINIISSYDILTSKNQCKYPIINGIILHSEYDPIDEAKKFIFQFESLLKQKNHILVLGLGFGYHVNEIIKKMKSFHLNNYQIWVVEPLEEIIRDCRLYNPIYDDHLKIIQFSTVDEFYANKEFVEFLITSPGLISHPATLQVNEVFFRQFFKYQSSNKIKHVIEEINNIEIKNYFSKFSTDDEIEKIINQLKKRNSILKKIDHFLLAYDQI